eukprot:232414-Pleurochrysis_carterae.AAC.3
MTCVCDKGLLPGSFVFRVQRAFRLFDPMHSVFLQARFSKRTLLLPFGAAVALERKVRKTPIAGQHGHSFAPAPSTLALMSFLPLGSSWAHFGCAEEELSEEQQLEL